MSEITTAEVRRIYGSRLSTHSFDCWKFHPACAALALADRVEELEAEVERLQDDAESDWEVFTAVDGIRAAEEEGR